MRLGLDVFGGDFAPDATIKGAILARKELSKEHAIVLLGDKEIIEAKLSQEGQPISAFDIIHCPDTIGMGEHPAKAFMKKPNSSIGVGFQLLKENELDAFASAGNSGAMLAGCMLSIKPVHGVIRPTITSVLPRLDGSVGIILDVGTNIDCKPDVLYQFGILGSQYAKYIHQIENPKVGLINIGEEEEKGNLTSQAAHVQMRDSKEFNFIGNVEGRDIFDNKVDVIVCDGFTGNIILKQAEAFYSLIKKRGIQDSYFDRFNYELYGGTPVLGVNSNVIIGHGISSPLAIKNMINLAREVADVKLASKIREAFQ